jgi:hypothetical protein
MAAARDAGIRSRTCSREGRGGSMTYVSAVPVLPLEVTVVASSGWGFFVAFYPGWCYRAVRARTAFN